MRIRLKLTAKKKEVIWLRSNSTENKSISILYWTPIRLEINLCGSVFNMTTGGSNGVGLTVRLQIIWTGQTESQLTHQRMARSRSSKSLVLLWMEKASGWLSNALDSNTLCAKSGPMTVSSARSRVISGELVDQMLQRLLAPQSESSTSLIICYSEQRIKIYSNY